MPNKYALIIGNTEYTDSGLAKLNAPGKDAEDFARVLKSPDIAAFNEVITFINESVFTLNEAIEDFFSGKKPDDLLVFYFSGHGVRDESGSLFLAVKNTNRSRLRSTAIKADFVRELMDQSRSRRQVIILDCCNSGAFARGIKAEMGGPMGFAEAFEGKGYGHVVLTATDSTQFAWEGDRIIGDETVNSLFTHFLVKGLEGEADEDGDGRITVDELYDYAYEQIVNRTPKQTPGKWSYKQQGEIVLRQSIRTEHVKPIPLPADLIAAMESTLTFVREGAVKQLESLLKGKNIGLAQSAKEALGRIAEEDDSRRVAQSAAQILTAFKQWELEEKAKREAEALALQKAREERKAEQERITLAKIEAEREAKEKAERLAAQKIEEERVALAKIEAQREAKEKAERLAAQKAEEERFALAKIEAQREAKEKAERLAAQKAEDERISLAKIESDRKVKEESDRLAAKNIEGEYKDKELKVFICYARADYDRVRVLHDRLIKDGVDVWLDKVNLLPGQDWELEIRKAVRETDVVIVCLSKQFNQAGFQQKEVKLALNTADEKLEGEIFIIPARLEECSAPESLRKWHWVDLFESDGYGILILALHARANSISGSRKRSDDFNRKKRQKSPPQAAFSEALSKKDDKANNIGSNNNQIDPKIALYENLGKFEEKHATPEKVAADRKTEEAEEKRVAPVKIETNHETKEKADKERKAGTRTSTLLQKIFKDKWVIIGIVVAILILIISLCLLTGYPITGNPTQTPTSTIAITLDETNVPVVTLLSAVTTTPSGTSAPVVILSSTPTQMLTAADTPTNTPKSGPTLKPTKTRNPDSGGGGGGGLCLSIHTQIDTPQGLVAVEDLQIGDLVWTVDTSGARVPAVILKTAKTSVPASHQMVHVTLSDGRELWASPSHPTADGRTLGALQQGDLLDGARVIQAERVIYGQPATYDILPAGATGFYWADGILIGSTLTDR
jgi:hypothetical protein